jgi:hypothetical protein
MPDDHSNSVPPLPIPNRTVKRAYADDSAATSVKVGYRQASYMKKPRRNVGFFFVRSFVIGPGRRMADDNPPKACVTLWCFLLGWSMSLLYNAALRHQNIRDCCPTGGHSSTSYA